MAMFQVLEFSLSQLYILSENTYFSLSVNLEVAKELKKHFVTFFKKHYLESWDLITRYFERCIIFIER